MRFRRTRKTVNSFRELETQKCLDAAISGIKVITMLIGLTGSFGSGKTSVSECFKKLGAYVVNSDESVAKIYQSNEDFLAKLRKKLGDEMFTEDGRVDRRALGNRVFSNSEELRWLEENLHPLVREERDRQVAAHPDALWIIEIPLLFEKKP